MTPSPLASIVEDIEVEVVVRLAEREMSLAEILALAPGSTIIFEQTPDDVLSVEIDSRPIARARPVERSGRLGVRLEAPTLLGDRRSDRPSTPSSPAST